MQRAAAAIPNQSQVSANSFLEWLRVNLDEALQRPVFDRHGRGEREREIVGDGMRLEPHSVGGE